MKNFLFKIIMVSLLTTCIACSNSATTQTTNSPQSNDTTIVQNETETAEDITTTNTEDVDLTVLSSTMVYAEVYNMMTKPDSYIGRNVKMEGIFSVYRTDEREYFSVIIVDATACCSQGIEFVLDGDYHFPEDYPEVGSTITVEGTFDVYTETFEHGTAKYVQLINAAML